MDDVFTYLEVIVSLSLSLQRGSLYTVDTIRVIVEENDLFYIYL